MYVGSLPKDWIMYDTGSRLFIGTHYFSTLFLATTYEYVFN